MDMKEIFNKDILYISLPKVLYENKDSERKYIKFL